MRQGGADSAEPNQVETVHLSNQQISNHPLLCEHKKRNNPKCLSYFAFQVCSFRLAAGVFIRRRPVETGR